MSVTKAVFGKLSDGREVSVYTIRTNRLCAKVTDLGAVLVSLYTPDRNGEVKDICLGYDNAEYYLDNPGCLGATVGPNANRIAGASFVIGGVEYHIPANEGANNLHSDMMFYKRLFNTHADGDSVTFVLGLPDGDAGFPGNRIFSITYTLTDEDLRIDYHAKSDKKTVINLTNHSYFNLAGEDSGSIADHVMKLNCSCFTKIVKGAIPTGEITPVKGTALDFTEAKPIGRDLDSDEEQMTLVCDPASGRVMQVLTTVPGMQVYTANFLNDEHGKGGRTYGPRSGLALETQFFPDNVHHDNFPSSIFGADTEYDSTTIYRFPACR